MKRFLRAMRPVIIAVMVSTAFLLGVIYGARG